MIHQGIVGMESTMEDTTGASNRDFGHCFFAGRDVTDRGQSIIDEYESHGLA